MLFTAIRYTLVAAAIRAIFLVRYTFAVLMELTLMEERRKSGSFSPAKDAREQ